MQISAASLNVKFSTAPAGKKNDMLEQMREREREMKLRENEDKRIAELQKRITEVADSTELDAESKEMKIESLADQIQQIHEARAERERMAMEREVQRRQQERDENLREQEKAGNAKNPTPEEAEAALVKEDIEGMVKLAVSFDGIHRLKQTRANRAAEAERLRQDIGNDTGLMQIGRDITIKTKGMHEFEHHFRNRNLAKLEQGIAALDDAVNREVGRLNRSTGEWAEDRLEITARTDNEDEEVKSNDESKPASEETAKANDDKEKSADDTGLDNSKEDSNIPVSEENR
jgi:hypothetical protein